MAENGIADAAALHAYFNARVEVRAPGESPPVVDAALHLHGRRLVDPVNAMGGVHSMGRPTDAGARVRRRSCGRTAGGWSAGTRRCTQTCRAPSSSSPGRSAGGELPPRPVGVNCRRDQGELSQRSG
jgi:hypothetical protein